MGRQGVLEENGRFTVEESLPKTAEDVVAEGNRVAQVLRADTGTKLPTFLTHLLGLGF